MKVCLGLLVVMFCQDDKPAVPIDSFCQRYERQMLSAADSAAVKQLPRSLRDRINGNDLDYYCRCPSPKDVPICKEALK